MNAMKFTMTGASILALLTSSATAGGLADPIAPIVIEDMEQDSSSAAIIVPLLVIALIALAASGGSDDDGDDVVPESADFSL